MSENGIRNECEFDMECKNPPPQEQVMNHGVKKFTSHNFICNCKNLYYD